VGLCYQTAAEDVKAELSEIRNQASTISEDTRLLLEYQITTTVANLIKSKGLDAEISRELQFKVIEPFRRQHPPPPVV
jgi:hypothetical protein